MTQEEAAGFLRSCGWICTGVTHRRGARNQNPETITWWQRFEVELPQFFALDLERLGWTRIIGL